jgi:ribonuclease HI
MLGLDIDINRNSDHGKSVALWVSDEFRSRIDLCGDSKDAIIFKLRQWTRQAILRALQERCTVSPDKSRKDMKDISCYVDVEATNANFAQRKGSHQYANDKLLTNTLKSIISGSIRLGDRLHAAGFINTDQCTDVTCDGRHTTMHVFWTCTRHRKRRAEFQKQYDKLYQYANQYGGAHATAHLEQLLTNETFKMTGICPDDLYAKVYDTRKRDMEQVKQSVPQHVQMIEHSTDGLVYEMYNGESHAVVYTDGSLYDPNSQHFARSGWGFYVNQGHAANIAKPLDTPHPSVFRAELRALLHAVQVCAIPTIVRSDCKSACQLAHAAIYHGKYDTKHADADILCRIAEISNRMCVIEWIPAHLDEDKYKDKRKAFLASGGTELQIESNCQADALAKQGAEMVNVDEQCYFRFKVRKWLTRIVQNMMVDIWSAEKSRMYGTPQLAKLAQDDQDAIQQIQSADFDQEEHEDPYEQYGDENDDFCDFDGNDIQKVQKPTSEVAKSPAIIVFDKQSLPGIDDNEADVNKYLHVTYPDQCKDMGALEYATIEIQEKWTYVQFPITCKASYSKDDNSVVKFDIKRHMWEPYQWFFQTMQWSKNTDNAGAANTVTFCELAIIAHIMTGGATTKDQDLCIATKLMKAAFIKYHKQEFRYDGKSGTYKHTFKPNGKLKNLIFLGGEHMPGIERKPFIDNDMQDSVRAAIWRVAQLWRASPNTRFGQGAYLEKYKKCIWKADVMHWAETMCDSSKESKNAANNASTSIAVAPPVKVQTSVPVQQICFYGHRSTSTTGPSGKQIWRKAPKTPWPDVPVGRVLCQKCYQAHRIAYENGQSQCIIEGLYMAGHPDTISAEPLRSSITTTDEPAFFLPQPTMNDGDFNCLSAFTTASDPDFECDICALDIIDSLTFFSYHMAWFRLGEKCFKHPSHDNNDMLTTSTARPPGEKQHL